MLQSIDYFAPDFGLVAYLSLAPILIPLLLLAARGDDRRAIVALSAGGLACLLVGLILNDGSVGFHFRDSAITNDGFLPDDPPLYIRFFALFLSEALVPVGILLALAAIFFALRHATRARKWGWLAALALSVPILTLAESALFFKSLIFQVNPSFAFHVMLGPALEHDSTPATVYFLTINALLVLAPLPTLLYGLRHRPAGGVSGAPAPVTTPAADIK